ncbi:MAG: Uma2 family endonuclease [Prochlorotrichaceae cyanobacterium]|jgi:Uma2 family endonuclease
MITAAPPLSLHAFLQQPETKPAREYFNGESIPKPMPTTRHSLLQFQLAKLINELTLSQKIACALPELRCTFGSQSIVPDLAVILWSNLQLNEAQEPLDAVTIAPDWIIEIRSPNQSNNRVLAKIFFALDQGTQLGWLVDPDDRSILICEPQKQPTYCTGQMRLPVLSAIPLNLTVEQVFQLMKLT